MGEITAHQIWAGSEQDSRKAADNMWLYPFFFFLANSSKEYCYCLSQVIPRYEQQEQMVQQNDFVSEEGLSSPPAQDSREEGSTFMSQHSYNFSEGGANRIT